MHSQKSVLVFETALPTSTCIGFGHFAALAAKCRKHVSSIQLLACTLSVSEVNNANVKVCNADVPGLELIPSLEKYPQILKNRFLRYSSLRKHADIFSSTPTHYSVQVLTLLQATSLQWCEVSSRWTWCSTWWTPCGVDIVQSSFHKRHSLQCVSLIKTVNCASIWPDADVHIWFSWH